jgi:hypothetical protein
MGRRRAAAVLKRRAATAALVPTDATGKPRGGASHACPRCGERTEVIDTRRHEDGVGVRRVRQCASVQCRHKFATDEQETFW